MEQPRWMVQAWAHLFEREYAGARANPIIADFFRDAGHPAYSLVAYGSAWYRWYMRRLAERPANVFFALRQIIP